MQMHSLHVLLHVFISVCLSVCLLFFLLFLVNCMSVWIHVSVWCLPGSACMPASVPLCLSSSTCRITPSPPSIKDQLRPPWAEVRARVSLHVDLCIHVYENRPTFADVSGGGYPGSNSPEMNSFRL